MTSRLVSLHDLLWRLRRMWTVRVRHTHATTTYCTSAWCHTQHKASRDCCLLICWLSETAARTCPECPSGEWHVWGRQVASRAQISPQAEQICYSGWVNTPKQSPRRPRVKRKDGGGTTSHSASCCHDKAPLNLEGLSFKEHFGKLTSQTHKGWESPTGKHGLAFNTKAARP